MLRGRVKQDPVVQGLQHRFHGLHTAHQPHQFRSNVAHGAHHRHNPGGGAGRTARASTLIRHPTSKRVDFLADTWKGKKWYQDEWWCVQTREELGDAMDGKSITPTPNLWYLE